MTNVLVCVKCGGSCIRNGIAVRKQRWKCSKCGKGFYTEVEKEGVVNPFKVLMEGKYQKCRMCGVETLNGALCDCCELVKGWGRDGSDVNLQTLVGTFNELKGLNGLSEGDRKVVDEVFEGLDINGMFNVTVEMAKAEDFSSFKDFSPLVGCSGHNEIDRDRELIEEKDFSPLLEREERKLEMVKIKAFNDMVDSIKIDELSLEDVNLFVMQPNYSESDKGELLEQLTLFN